MLWRALTVRPPPLEFPHQKTSEYLMIRHPEKFNQERLLECTIPDYKIVQCTFNQAYYRMFIEELIDDCIIMQRIAYVTVQIFIHIERDVRTA